MKLRFPGRVTTGIVFWPSNIFSKSVLRQAYGVGPVGFAKLVPYAKLSILPPYDITRHPMLVWQSRLEAAYFKASVLVRQFFAEIQVILRTLTGIFNHWNMT